LKGYETSWYGRVKRIEVIGDKAVVTTDLGSAETKTAGTICGAVSSFVFSARKPVYPGVTKTEVLGINGDTLALKDGNRWIRP
jgi:hypothetical protein